MRYEMLMFYVHGMPDKNVNDGIREYCLCERVDEEYLRMLIKEKKLKNIFTAINTKFKKCFEIVSRTR
jgi:hypothetical protein